MNAEIISIGTEILLGHIVNTNAAYLSRQLASNGINLYYHSTVGDNPSRLLSAISLALSRSDIVITTGGLGPTVDDITLSHITKAVSGKLYFKKEILKSIDSYFKKKGITKIPQDARRQAYIPEGSVWFENKVGTAPGIYMEYRGKVIIALPGPPRELEPMFEKDIMPFLKRKNIAKDTAIKTRAIKITGIVESAVNAKTKKFLKLSGDVTVGIYAHLGEVSLKITGSGPEKKIRKVENGIKKILGDYIYGYDKDTLESVVGNLLRKKKKTLAIAESCTGGLIADRITNISGSSRYFKMGLVTYSDKSKNKLLFVPEEKIKKFGAVSGEVALDMSKGVKKIADSSVALAVTGIAGPTGETKKKPVGLVYIAMVTDRKKIVRKYLFRGKREEIKHLASTAALDLIRKNL